MKLFLFAAITLVGTSICVAQQAAAYLSDSGYQKEMASAADAHRKHRYADEIYYLNSASKKAHGESAECLAELCRAQFKIGQYKDSAESAARLESVAKATGDKATASFLRGVALLRLNEEKRKQDGLAEADKEFKNALTLAPDMNSARFVDGTVLALMNRDDEARAQFAAYVEHATATDTYRQRGERFLANPGLAREKMAPPFSIVTADGTPLSLDSLNGRVVLIDFWATWCGPCKVELPHVKKLAQKYAGKPFIVLSVSIDRDEAKWKDYVTKNEMTWPQYNDQKGSIAEIFGVHSIPHYFTIDTDGILRSENIGDGANIDGRIKKLVAQAEESHAAAPSVTGSTSTAPQTDAQPALANPASHR